MSEYTPTTERVRHCATTATAWLGFQPESFDHWLARHDAEIHTAALEGTTAKIERMESAYARLNRAQLRTLELDRKFLQQVADSYGIRTDEVTEAFLARAAAAIRAAKVGD